jgi:uncharacterized protein (TIGR00369 family)
MNDKPEATPAGTFDPARAGWKIISSNTAFGDLVGPVWRRKEGERARFGFVAAPKHLNRAGNLHGGMLMTLADNAMAITAREASGAQRHATIELNIQFIGAVRLGEFVEAHPEVARSTRSLTFMQAKMFVGTRLVVTTNGIWKILDEAS